MQKVQYLSTSSKSFIELAFNIISTSFLPDMDYAIESLFLRLFPLAAWTISSQHLTVLLRMFSHANPFETYASCLLLA